MRLAMLGSEMAPLAKVGGLADVVGALPPALREIGVDVRVALPLYGGIDRARWEVRPDPEVPRLALRMAAEEMQARFFRAADPSGGVPVHLVASDAFFDRDGIYDDPATGEGYPDNALRFLFFARAALELFRALGWRPDVLHCHDHQTAPAIADLRVRLAGDPFYTGVGGVFTIHNLGYQGIFPPSILPWMGVGPERFYPMSPFEFFGNVNFMKVGIQLADVVTTVSERYAQEIRESPEHGAGLEGVLRSRAADLVGILNGVDYARWDPAVDRLIPHRYGPGDLSGKALDRDELRRRFGLPVPHRRVPVIGMVSRLVDQKGFDLLEQAMPALAAMDVQLAVLGTGQERYGRMLEEAARRLPAKVAARLRFDDAMAHLVEAGADMFLMPSRYEPCGLNQMYSLRYGTVPVVRATGGLADTVLDDDARPGEGTGFSFEAYDAGAMLDALRRAAAAFADESRWTALMLRGMRRDHSWKASARRYVEAYEKAAESGRRRLEALAQEV
jgi:starch synthase